MTGADPAMTRLSLQQMCSIGSRQPEVDVVCKQSHTWLQLEAENGGARLDWAGAWQLGCDERRLAAATKYYKENASDDLDGSSLELGLARGALGKWLVLANARGVATRQEVVSMIPVALLNISHEHTVLDMCASPGSKTTQVCKFRIGLKFR